MTLDIDAVVFDLDATLINLGGHVSWSNAHVKAIKVYIESGCDEELVNECSSRGLFNMLDELWNFISTNNLPEAHDIQQRVYDEIGKFELEGSLSCSLMPGCLNALQWLSENEIPLGICTSNSKSSAVKALEIQNLLHYFKSIIGRETKYRMKPYPDQLLACFESLNVEPSRGVMVGDSPKDILAGKAVNAYTIAIPVYFTKMEKLKETNPNIIINNLDQLPAVLLDI